jgi:subtilisin family serine protease
MPQQIAGFPYWELRFDESGNPADAAAVQRLLDELPAEQLSDLFVFSHGWNNDAAMARSLYRRYFEKLREVNDQLGSPGIPRQRPARIGVVGVLWPSMRWADEDGAAEGFAAGGIAGVGAAPTPGAARSDAELVRDLKAVFVKPQQQQALDELATLLAQRPRDAASLSRFQQLLRPLTAEADVTATVEDSGEHNLLTEAPQTLFLRFAAVAPRRGDEGGVAGLLDPLERLWDGAKEALRQATYWQMKKRAGVVGQRGLGPVLARIQLGQAALRVHLLGHSFGARLVSFSLAGLPPSATGAASPVKSLLLLQGAFSHFAFAPALPHDPTRAGALAGMQARVDGPLAVTHSKKDTAVGVFYPMASLASGDDRAAIEDYTLRWGAMGANGAQAVSATGVPLGPMGCAYPFAAGRFVNLDGNAVIIHGGPPSGAHSDIVHPELAWATLAAAGIAGGSTAPSQGGVASMPSEPVAKPQETAARTADAAQAQQTAERLLRHGTMSEAFAMPEATETMETTERTQKAEERRRVGLMPDNKTPGPVMIELNLMHAKGLRGADADFKKLYQRIIRNSPESLIPIANTYFRCHLSVDQVRQLVREDQSSEVGGRAVYRIWPDFPIEPLIDRSISTVKADAARRSYDASGTEICWAVIDSGIDKNHAHFLSHNTLGGDIAELHYDFTLPEGASDAQRVASALTDPLGHGTHVAGIIAGALPAGIEPIVGQHISADLVTERIQRRTVERDRLAGVAPRAKLVSLRVIGTALQNYSSNVIRALQYVRETVNGNGKLLRIHGVNLSLGYEFNAKWFACGQSPICVEVDRLVRSGIVVVVAAGNTGYGVLRSVQRDTSTGLSLTINDPGNAALAITVGSTHRDSPYTYGVSYFSSKGPTGDGRLKPDLVAPGERITSCAAGQKLAAMRGLYSPNTPETPAAYVDDSGTSMAAPHVSGAIAAFLSIRREFVGQPERVKEIFLKSATSLGRERYFEGNGLVDLMRAIQSV